MDWGLSSLHGFRVIAGGEVVRLKPSMGDRRVGPASCGALMLSLLAIACCNSAAIGADPPVDSKAAASDRPNILFIVADDLGYGELGCQGHPEIPTPNIDSIARHGCRFTSGYVSCPVCSPTRAGLMTGRYQQRFGHEFNPGPVEDASDAFGLNRDEKTIAERLKAAGYATGMVGKWHLGTREGLRPTDRGFDEFFGFLGGAHPYVGNRRRAQVMRGTQLIAEQEYLTDAFRREAVAFVDRHKSQPFFLYLAFNAVHAPLQATDKYRERFPKVDDPKRQTFCAMLSAMDDAIGAVLTRLHDARLEEKTLIFFISDNGGPTPQTTSRNNPLRGTKATTWEGGIRIPFMIQWKGHVPEGKVDDRPVIGLDLHPTALAAAGVTAAPEKKLDGVNLLPYLQGGNTGLPHAVLFWRFGAQMAVRSGDWKITRAAGQPGLERKRKRLRGPVVGELFNLAQDIGESKDLAADHTEKVKELMDAWEKWNSELMAPRWQRASPPRRRAAGKT
jgi:arylsulfatase A-like enzyme